MKPYTDSPLQMGNMALRNFPTTITNTLYGHKWWSNSADPSQQHFMGISLHKSHFDSSLFKKSLYEGYGSAAPQVYMSPVGELEVAATDAFYSFVKNLSSKERRGIFITTPTLAHIPEFELLIDSESIKDIVLANFKWLKPDINTLDALFKEIIEDTNLWYEHIDEA